MFLIILLALFVPLQAMLVPFFLVMRQLGLLNNYAGLVLAQTAFSVPVTTFLFASYFRGLPGEVLEAAKVDGATTLRTIWSVVMPMSRPALATTGILVFVGTMNSFLLPLLVMSKPELQVLIVNLALARGQYFVEPTLSAAGVVYGIVPMLIIGLFAQRFLIKGATAGAVK